MTGTGFAVPVAFASSGRLVRPSEANVGEHHRCPGCSADVVLRRGTMRRPHFAHRGGDGCSTESALHRAAKQEVLRVIAEWKSSQGPRPCVSRPCPRYGCEGGTVQDLPDDVTHAAAEVRLGGGPIVDVILYRGDTPAAAIEILVTSRVGDHKARLMTVPWMELRAEEVLDRPYWWVTVQDGLQPFSCVACENRRTANLEVVREVERRAAALAARLGVTMPPGESYRAVPHRCWRCDAEMMVFHWPGGGGYDARRPPAPIPGSVRSRVTDGGGTYWANCCPACASVQGDYYLGRDNADYALVRELTEDPYGCYGTGGGSP